MQRILANIEALTPASFVLLVGLVGGGLQGIPRLLLGGIGGTSARAAHVAIAGASALLWCLAALLLWRVAVRRRRWSSWATGAQVTLGLALAHLLAIAMGMVDASIETNGMFAEALLRDPLAVAVPNLFLAFILMPLWFLGTVTAVALGRHWARGAQVVETPSVQS